MQAVCQFCYASYRPCKYWLSGTQAVAFGVSIALRVNRCCALGRLQCIALAHFWGSRRRYPLQGVLRAPDEGYHRPCGAHSAPYPDILLYRGTKTPLYHHDKAASSLADRDKPVGAVSFYSGRVVQSSPSSSSALSTFMPSSLILRVRVLRPQPSSTAASRRRPAVCLRAVSIMIRSNAGTAVSSRLD